MSNSEGTKRNFELTMVEWQHINYSFNREIPNHFPCEICDRFLEFLSAIDREMLEIEQSEQIKSKENY